MNILFGRHKSVKILEHEPEIRSTFAQEVLDLEVETNFSCTLENIKALMELYTQAIEYYLPLKSPKLNYYHEKMQKLLTRADVLEVLGSENKSQANENFQEGPKINKIPANIVKLPLERTCEKVLQSHNLNSSSITKTVVEHLKTQNDSLKLRLESRKKARIEHPFKPKRPETSPFDRSGGEAKLSPIDAFEADVEAIMEKFVEEKNWARKETEEKYKEYVNELEEMEGDIMKKVLRELKKNMEIEIENRFKEIEENRNQAIALARKRLINKC